MNLATIEKIENVREHPNADRLDLVNILGYQCVTQKGLYENGDVVVYVKTDTLLPHEHWAEAYRKHSPNRVKAVKLRKEWSEGIVIPLNEVRGKLVGLDLNDIKIGYDVSEELKITKWEPPIPQDLKAKSSVLPYDIPKTDENRWENIKNHLPFGENVDITLKIDGSSVTYGYKLDEGDFFVTSRGQELHPYLMNNYTLPLGKYNIEKLLKEYCNKHNVSLALRGEVYGEGIQSMGKNPHSKFPKDVAFFSVYLIDERRYARKGDKHYFINVCKDLNLPTVDILQENVELNEALIDYYSKVDKIIDVGSFEGVVIQHSEGSFKVINKLYDSKK